MLFMREAIFAALLIVACNGEAKEYKKKSGEGVKRAVESYSYPVPTVTYEDGKESTPKGKVIVETIKSISPSEYLTSPGYSSTTLDGSSSTSSSSASTSGATTSSASISSASTRPISASTRPSSASTRPSSGTTITTTTGNVPIASVTYEAFESDTSKKSTTLTLSSTETAPVTKKKTGYRHYTGSSTAQKQTTSSVQFSSTNPPAPVRTTSGEPSTTLFSGYQYSRPSNIVQASAAGEIGQKSLRIISNRGKLGNGRYNLQKIIKKPTKIDPKHSDSKPEETGYNGYHFDGSLGSLNYESKNTGSQSGMMGASYMRSSSPFYNFHVMLD